MSPRVAKPFKGLSVFLGEGQRPEKLAAHLALLVGDRFIDQRGLAKPAQAV